MRVDAKRMYGVVVTETKIAPLALGEEVPDTHSVTGWPRSGTHESCGARAAMLHATWYRATYECRGTPTDPRSAYGPDGCGAVFTVSRPGEDPR